MVLENFTTWNLLDAGSKVTRSANELDIRSLQNSETARCWKVYDPDTFGAEFIHSFSIKAWQHWSTHTYHCAYALGNVLNNEQAWINAKNEAIGFTVGYSTTGYLFLLYNYELGNVFDYVYVTGGQQYWVDIIRAGVSLQAKIYSDATKETLVSTLTRTLNAARTYSIAFGFNSRNSGYADKALSYYVWDLDLGTEPTPIPIFRHHYELLARR